MVLAALALGACQASDLAIAPAAAPIIGGTVDTGDPAVVYVHLEGANASATCSGTLISKRIVLTAAHCADGTDGLEPIAVFFGGPQVDFNASSKWSFVKKKLVHPQWTGDLADGYDIALLQLDGEAPTAPRPISRSVPNVGGAVRFVGWGNDVGTPGSGSGTKRQTTSTLRGLQADIMIVCDVVSGGQCVSSTHGTCQGDSGGPAFMNLGGQEVVAGITSFGDVGCDQYGGYTRVDLYAESFIDPFVQANDAVSCGADGACAANCPTVDPDCPCKQDGQCNPSCTSGNDLDCCGAGNTCVPSGCASPDPDCAAGPDCDLDATCNAACQPRDPDCPRVGTGERCDSGADCVSDLCIPASDEPGLGYCSARCGDGAAACPDGMQCVPASDGTSVCWWPTPTPGALGGACSEGPDCKSGLCVDWDGGKLCTALCDPAQGCRAGFDCIPTSGVEHVCVPEPLEPNVQKESGWFACAVHAGRGARGAGGAGVLAVLTGLLALSRHARRR